MEKIKVYGADWCSMTKRSLKLLDNLNADYEYINVEQDETASAWVKKQNPDGKERKPTIKVGAQVLIEPDDAELTKAVVAGSGGD